MDPRKLGCVTVLALQVSFLAQAVKLLLQLRVYQPWWSGDLGHGGLGVLAVAVWVCQLRWSVDAGYIGHRAPAQVRRQCLILPPPMGACCWDAAKNAAASPPWAVYCPDDSSSAKSPPGRRAKLCSVSCQEQLQRRKKKERNPTGFFHWCQAGAERPRQGRQLLRVVFARLASKRRPHPAVSPPPYPCQRLPAQPQPPGLFSSRLSVWRKPPRKTVGVLRG